MFARHSNSQSFTSLPDLSVIIQAKEFECYTELCLIYKITFEWSIS